MSIKVYERLSGEAETRRNNQLKQQQSLMANLYKGMLPPEYEQYFPKNAPRTIVQLIKNAWDDLATSAGRFPDLRSDALDETAREEKAAGLHERIGNHYLRTAEPTGKQFMWQLAWSLVGTGSSVALVRPDTKKKSPVLTIRDARTAMPNMRTVNGVPVEIYDVLFEYEIPEKTAIEQGLAEKGKALAGPINTTSGRQGKQVKVYEFIDDKAWTVVSSQGFMTREEHGLDVVPAWVFQNFNPDENEGGLSLFKDQVSMMVAVSMLVTMKLAAADKNVNPIYWAKGHVGSVKLGPNVLNKLSSQGEMGRLDPPLIPQVDRDIEQLVQFSNIFNKNPEVRQGQVNSKGAYTSAKTLEQLNEAVDTTIGQYWDIIAPGMQHLLGACYRMDDVLWPNEEKRITTNIKGKTMRDVYTPSKDIDGRYHINVDYGFGIGGYQGFLQNLQANQAKVRSRKAAMEAMPGVSDVDQEMRQIQIEDLDDAQMANIQSQAAAGQMDMVFMANLRKSVAKGKPVHEAIVKLTEEAQAQAQAAIESGATAPVTNPEQEMPHAQQGPANPPGLNPAAVV